MIPLIIFLLSIGLQLTAAILALLLIRTTGKKLAWILISLAMVLMVSRRIVSFVSLVAAGKEITFTVPELIAFIISCLMLTGVVLIREHFKSVNLAKNALEESEKRLNIVFENAKDAILWADAETGLIIKCNKEAEILLEREKEEIIGCHQTALHPPEKAEYYADMFKKHIERKGVIDEEAEIITKFGVITPVHISASITSVGEKTIIQGIFSDITEQKRLEEQLRHAQKMEAIGTLTGGIAHDFNNILTAIIGYADLMHMKMGKDDPLRANVEQILKASERAANLIQSLLAFSRKQIMEPGPVNLNHIIKTVENLITKVIGEDVELKTILTDKDLTIMADSGQIEQVLINLCINARDAMPKGGLLTISIRLTELDKEYIKAHGYGKEGKYALISITDTGRGMDDKTREKIFEPFFTTKEVGKGTGLGLSIVYGIIKQHNGYINVYSELDKGTTFKVYLPVVESEVKQAKAEAVSSLKGGTEAVLVAEDDVVLRKLIKDVLEGFGYKVIMAEDGEKAIERFMESRDEIKLALLDVIMPKKNGKEVYEEIKKIKPDIKVLFVSGYTADVMDKKEMLEKGLEFILKPISPKELLRKMRDVLDR